MRFLEDNNGYTIRDPMNRVSLTKHLMLVHGLVIATILTCADAAANPNRSIPTFLSAYIQREVGMSLYRTSDLNKELSLHFENVLDKLHRDWDASLDVALRRLEQHSDQRWSDRQRQRWRTRLAMNRMTNIIRLRQYQLRGVFPQNNGKAKEPIPIVVDDDGTAWETFFHLVLTLKLWEPTCRLTVPYCGEDLFEVGALVSGACQNPAA